MLLISANNKRNIGVLFISLTIMAISSCSKDTPESTNQTATIEEILTEKAWKADEIRVQLSNNSTKYYKRGGVTNTVNYDSDSLRFNINNTGIYYYLGSEYTTTWNFLNAEKSKMVLTVNFTPPLVLNLENINITQAYFKYAQYANEGGISYLASCTRTQN